MQACKGGLSPSRIGIGGPGRRRRRDGVTPLPSPEKHIRNSFSLSQCRTPCHLRALGIEENAALDVVFTSARSSRRSTFATRSTRCIARSVAIGFLKYVDPSQTGEPTNGHDSTRKVRVRSMHTERSSATHPRRDYQRGDTAVTILAPPPAREHPCPTSDAPPPPASPPPFSVSIAASPPLALRPVSVLGG